MTKDNLLAICDLMFNEYKSGLKGRGINISLSKSAKEYLVDKGFSMEYGARPLRRLIEKEVIDKVAVMILSKEIKSGDKVGVVADKSKIKIVRG